VLGAHLTCPDSNKKRVLEVVNVFEESFVTITEGLEPTPAPEARRADAAALSPPAPTPVPAAPPAAKAAVFNPDAAEAAESGGDPAAKLAVVLTPFSGPPDAVECKSQETVNGEFEYLIPRGFTRFRYHGTACNQAFMGNTAARRTNSQVFLGAFDLRNVVAETQELVRQVMASGGWDHVHMVALGSEDLSKGMTAAEAVQQIQIGTDILRAAGYTGDILHPETVDNILNNGAIMCSPAAGTRLAINVFPFNNPNVVADEAGQEAARQTRLVSECSQRYSNRVAGKDVVLSEAGWPGLADGNNGAAAASADAQVRAIGSMVSTVPAEQYLFTAFDHTWQQNFAGSHGAEQHYGLFRKGYEWNWPQLRINRGLLIRHGRA
jgi:exo-beta-1,3-glucanase (GH17 family)